MEALRGKELSEDDIVVGIAAVMKLRGLSVDESAELLGKSGGSLKKALGSKFLRKRNP